MQSNNTHNFAPPAAPPPGSQQNDNLPPGWTKQHDAQSNRDFYVDTLAEPPRSIWTHPYEDPQFLEELDRETGHPSDVKGQSHKGAANPPSYADVKGSRPTTPVDNKQRQHLGGMNTGGAGPSSSSPPKGDGKPHQSLFGKLKDKAIGTKEERDARARERAAAEQAYMRRRQELMVQRQAQMQQMGGGGGGMFGPGGGAGGYGGRYAAPQYAYNGGGGGMMGNGGMMGQRRGGGGMGGMAMPLVGGLAGGMLLGEMMDGNDGGGYDGGGDMGGGDMGGGDF